MNNDGTPLEQIRLRFDCDAERREDMRYLLEKFEKLQKIVDAQANSAILWRYEGRSDYEIAIQSALRNLHAEIEE